MPMKLYLTTTHSSHLPAVSFVFLIMLSFNPPAASFLLPSEWLMGRCSSMVCGDIIFRYICKLFIITPSNLFCYCSWATEALQELVIVSRPNKANKQQMTISCTAHTAAVWVILIHYFSSAEDYKLWVNKALCYWVFFSKAWDPGTAEWCKINRQPTVLIVIHHKVLFLGNSSSFSLFKCGGNGFKALGNAVEISLQCTHAGKNVGSGAN